MTAKVKQSCRKIERQRADFDFRKCDRGMKKHAEGPEASGMNRVRNTSPRSDHRPLAGRFPVLSGMAELRGRANDEIRSIGQPHTGVTRRPHRHIASLLPKPSFTALACLAWRFRLHLITALPRRATNGQCRFVTRRARVGDVDMDQPGYSSLGHTDL
ncbi:hypothetical protein [Burkholderia ubonensis]|uniref:hypothetical protein n=1 Tax=Burkholderia ubonensis TaxID=101571 RepID=UPI000B0D1305|nr:hypothetical protein [Burkholderia ubonensis]